MSVRMSHDGIDQEIEVAEISVPQYERSGWKVVDGQPGKDTAAAKGRRRAEEGN
ncbi:hypothetical protein [Streptomyces sp. HYC2]|uniref:hypothetical protein n=1 Tax=Streptomyces sp. HYC2 TaxID=2955207 RepID=UPI0024805C8B|nr:hypothetical protein [Streptomyces sp. HYC2]